MLDRTSKVLLEYDLSKPEQVYAYECAKKGLEACLLLESLKESLSGYREHKKLPESVLMDMIKDLDKWEEVKL